MRFRAQRFFYFLAITITFASCGEIREEITIKEDGSGSYDISSDMIPMMRGMMMSFTKMGLQDGETLDSAAMMQEVENMIWKDFPEEVDSIIDYSDKVPEEYRDDPEKAKILENTNMYMRGGRSKGYLNTGLEYRFDNTSDFEEFFVMLEEGRSKDKKGSMIGSSDTELKITEKSFYRSSKNESKESDVDIERMGSFLKDMEIVTVLNFPSEIKKIKVKTYEIVEQDKNSVTLKYNVLEAYQKGGVTSIDVQWK